MGGPYYFRDGTQYDGHYVCNYNPAKGEGKVRVFRPCDSCHGKPASTTWPYSCGACRGTGRSRSQTWVTVYASDRLDQLNANRNRQRRSLSALVLIGVKREWRTFVRQRDRLLTDMQTYAPESGPLQALYAKVNQGVVLTPGEIRAALSIVNSLREHHHVTTRSNRRPRRGADPAADR